MARRSRRNGIKLVLAAGLVVAGLGGAAQAGSSLDDAARTQESNSILRVEVQLHDSHSKPRGNREIAIVAFDDFYVFYYSRTTQYGDGLGGIRRLENQAVKAACRASNWACIALTGDLTIDVTYR
jgi:hypothetical protein